MLIASYNAHEDVYLLWVQQGPTLSALVVLVQAPQIFIIMLITKVDKSSRFNGLDKSSPSIIN